MSKDDPKVIPLRSGVSTTGPMSRPVHMLQNLAKESFTKHLRAVFDQVDDTFFDMADMADNHRQQTLYFDAMRLIRVQRKPIESLFFQKIDQRISNISAKAAAEVTPLKHARNEKGFQLLDEEDLEEIIALDTMVSRCLEKSALVFEELNARLSSLFPQDIAAHNNPYGPEELCDIFNEATTSLDIDIRSKLLLFKLFERNVLNELNAFYVQANELLARSGIEPKQQVKNEEAAQQKELLEEWESSKELDEFVSQVEKELSGETSRDIPQQKPAGSNRHGRLISRLSRLLRQAQGVSTAPETDLKEAELNDLVSQITDIQEGLSEAADSGLGKVRLVELLEERLQETLGPSRLNEYDRNVVQLVDDLLDHFDERSHIPRELVNLIQKTKLPLVKLALLDGAFFDKEQHPARRLLNEVAQLSLRFEEDGSSRQDPLFTEIQRLLEHVLSSNQLDIARLSNLFAEFLVKVDKYERRIQALEKRALEEVAAREKVNLANTRVTRVLADMLEGQILPEALVELAENAWSKVLFITYLKSGEDSEQWRTDIALFRALAEQVGSEARSRDQFAGLMEKIKARLAHVAFDSYQLGHLVGRLEQYCFPDLAGREMAEIQPDNSEKKVLLEAFQANLPGEINTETDEVNQAILGKAEGLVEGSWFDLLDQAQQHKRCKLAGIVKPVNKYVFVNRQGGVEQTLSKGKVAEKLHEKRLAMLDNRNLFDRSLDDVIHSIRTGQQGHTLH